MCTNIGAVGRSASPQGRVYLGSVSDDPYDIRTKVVLRRPKNGYAYVGTDLRPLSGSVSAAEYSDSVSGAPTRGLNEKGLAFTWALVFESKQNKAPASGLKPHQIWGAVMERCATVKEALALLETLPRDMGGAGMVADKSGDFAQVEIGRKRVEVPRVLSLERGGTAVNVNCWIAMQKAEGDRVADMENPSAPNKSRFSAASGRLAAAEGRIDVAGMKSILSDHAHKERFAGENAMVRGHGFSVCNHGSMRKQSFDSNEPAWGTVSAEIIDPVGGVFWYTYGWPCGEKPEHGDQMLQDRSWGNFIGFRVADLPAGDYTTLTGELTHLAAQHIDRLARFEA